MKSVMISISPESCGMIASGDKLIVVRKTKPNLETPFKCYIYCTKNPKMQYWTGPRYSYADDHSHNLFDRCGNGKVIGEFVCKNLSYIEADIDVFGTKHLYNTAFLERSICMSDEALFQYLYKGEGKNNGGWAWHISELVIYNEPKLLSDFNQCFKCKLHEGCKQHEYSCAGYYKLTKPPANWCYIEEET